MVASSPRPIITALYANAARRYAKAPCGLFTLIIRPRREPTGATGQFEALQGNKMV